MLMKFVRHPGYTGLFLSLYSFPMFFFSQGHTSRDTYHLGSWGEPAVYVVWVSVVTALFIQRIAFEESCLAEHFGVDFEAYKSGNVEAHSIYILKQKTLYDGIECERYADVAGFFDLLCLRAVVVRNGTFFCQKSNADDQSFHTQSTSMAATAA
jgi:hypothetical protein